MNHLKAAIIGLGKMGLVHASILSTLPNVEVVALCDKSRLILRLAKNLFKKATVVNDLEKLEILDLNVIYVTTPIPSHYPILKKMYSIVSSPNLFVEKTLASSWNNAQELSQSAKNCGGTNMVGYMKRFSMTFGKAKSLLDQNILGELNSFEAHAYSSDFSGIHESSEKSAKRGGVLNDLGSHVIDLASWFFGDFEVESVIFKSKDDRNFADSSSFKVIKKDLVGRFDISWVMDEYRMPDFGLTIKGENGILNVNDDTLELKLESGKSSIWNRQDLNDNVGFLLGEPEYYREDEYFINSIIQGSAAEPSFATASKVDYIIDQVKQKADRIEQ